MRVPHGCLGPYSFMVTPALKNRLFSVSVAGRSGYLGLLVDLPCHVETYRSMMREGLGREDSGMEDMLSWHSNGVHDMSYHAL